MEKDTYHHGFLKEELINKGLELISTEGVRAFTMRRVAELCKVSPTAAYKHFKSKDELLAAIRSTIAEDFKVCLLQSMQNREGMDMLAAIGRSYVSYLLEHHVACELLFHAESKEKIFFKNGELTVDTDAVFYIFYVAAEEYLKTIVADKRMRGYKILQMWCEVHGFAELISGGTIVTDDDIDSLVEDMLAAARIVK